MEFSKEMRDNLHKRLVIFKFGVLERRHPSLPLSVYFTVSVKGIYVIFPKEDHTVPIFEFIHEILSVTRSPFGVFMHKFDLRLEMIQTENFLISKILVE